MRLLLDSHTVIWAADDPEKIPTLALGLIQDPMNDRFISAATIWEIAIKVSKGRLPLSLPYRQWMERVVLDVALAILPIELDHTDRQTLLPLHHGDPFDRLIAAQSLVSGMPLVSADVIFDSYGVHRIWA